MNNAARELMAAIRRQHEDAQWIDLGLTHTRTGSDTFTIVGDYTSTYEAGRRVKMTGSATNYGTISASSYSAPDTTVTISEGNVPASLAAVAIGIISVSGSALPQQTSGSFTGTITGCTTSPTGTINWVKSGHMVSLYVTSNISGTSNSTTLTLTGLPSALRPTHTTECYVPPYMYDAGQINQAGYALVSSAGVITFVRLFDFSTTGAFGLGFTASGLKGLIGGLTITYALV